MPAQLSASDLEALARKWCKADGHDPDWMVMPDSYQIPVVQTPAGLLKSASHLVSKPLWHVYADVIEKFRQNGVTVSVSDPQTNN